MTEYRVDLDRLDDVTTRVGGLTTFIEESLIELEERITALQTNWSGQAADAHATAHSEWTAAAAKVRAALGEMQAAAEAHQSYEQTSAANVAMLGRGGESTQ
jgi:WXG100 family type VII secretion target